ncbi:tyrosine recombinase XerS [Lactococcus formosensis subsp. bovis]|uniref:tyrosine recombinase XerS n=1 Tax=Lactococcus formosensis TaxID=1281486 RepID=UPI001BCC9BA9|nr:tyrosine recombinase XerS [Lactococcus formosensis]
MKQENILKNIEKLKEKMPSFVLEYYHSKLSVPYSYATLYEYLKEFDRFFTWLIDSDAVQAKTTAEISVEVLENLGKTDIESFIIYLRERPLQNNQSGQRGVGQATLNRTIAALSSLYKFLTEEVENSEGEPYFYRNVMKKIKIKKRKETLASRAENIKGKLFLGEESQGFLDYIAEDYVEELSPKAKLWFERNKERDLAIIALMLASGLRLSEVVNANLKDLNLNTLIIEVIRKGGKKDAVGISPFAKPYLYEYLEIREKRYGAEKTDVALFLTSYRGQANRIDTTSIEKMVEKYSLGFKVRITPHKLRHTFATRLYEETNSQVLVSHQLGHSSTQVTDLYTHIVDEKQKDALDKL